MEIKPELHNGMTIAESMQVSMDYFGTDQVGDELIRFHGIHVEKIESFADQLKTYRGLEQEHSKKQESYRNLHDWASNPDKVISAALRASGVMVFESKSELQTESEKLADEGTGLSIAVRDYFKERMLDCKEIIINGTAYSLEYEVLTINKGKYILTLGSGEVFKAIARRVYICKGLDDVKQNAKHPTPADWETLVANLQTVARF